MRTVTLKLTQKELQQLYHALQDAITFNETAAEADYLHGIADERQPREVRRRWGRAKRFDLLGEELERQEYTQEAAAAANLITEDWLKSVGFKWHEMDRQHTKHWVLWIGWALRDPNGNRPAFCGPDELGIELALWDSDDSWFCWFRSDVAGRYHRFIHLRHLKYQRDLVAIIEALTGQAWSPANNMYGQMVFPEQAARWRKEDERLDIRMRKQGVPWAEAEQDQTRDRALPEHLDAAIKSGLAK